MKKRLLITSIVMMLVVAVALSTATYAWFTSNASVSASSMTLTANTSSAEALGIGWGMSTAEGASAGTELVSAVTGSLDPMAPTELTVDSTTSEVLFKTSTVKNINNVAVFNENGATRTPVTYNNGDNQNLKSAFFVKNLSTANTVGGITVKATIEPVFEATVAEEDVVAGYTYYNSDKVVLETQPTDKVAAAGFKAKNGVDLVRVAIFKYNSVSSSYKLVGVMASEAANTVYGNITANYVAPVGGAAQTLNGTTYTASVMQNFSAVAGSTGLELGSLGPQASHDLVAIAWLDGAAFGDSQQGLQATISLTFTKTAE